MNNKITTSKQLPFPDSQFVIKNAGEMREVANVPHRHSYYSILWSFNSQGKHIVDGDEYPFAPHRIFFIAPGQVHQILPPNPQGLLILFTREFFLTGITNQFLEDLFVRKQTVPLPLLPKTVKKMLDYANGMMDEYLSQNKYRTETIEAYLKLFLIECDKQYSQYQRENKKTANLRNPLVKLFIELVEVKYTQWHQVQDYANELKITARHLSETIKQHTGQSPKEYIKNRIVMEAKRHILFTDLSVKEIGYELGFDSPPQFSRFFKECTGLSFEKFAQSVSKE